MVTTPGRTDFLEGALRMSPEFAQRLTHNAAVTGSYQKAAEHAKRRGSPMSDDAIHTPSKTTPCSS